MDITTNCPACGATLSIEPDAEHIDCPFCGAKYNVDLSGVQPAFTLITPEEMTPEPIPVQSAQTETVEPSWISTPPAYQPSDPAPEPPQPWQPLAAPPVTVPPATTRKPIWIAIAIAVTLLVCGLCSCMFLAFFLMQRSNPIPMVLP